MAVVQDHGDMPINKTRRQTESTPWSGWWRSHMAEIYRDCGTREIITSTAKNHGTCKKITVFTVTTIPWFSCSPYYHNWTNVSWLEQLLKIPTMNGLARVRPVTALWQHLERASAAVLPLAGCSRSSRCIRGIARPTQIGYSSVRSLSTSWNLASSSRTTFLFTINKSAEKLC